MKVLAAKSDDPSSITKDRREMTLNIWVLPSSQLNKM